MKCLSNLLLVSLIEWFGLFFQSTAGLVVKGIEGRTMRKLDCVREARIEQALTKTDGGEGCLPTRESGFDKSHPGAGDKKHVA